MSKFHKSLIGKLKRLRRVDKKFVAPETSYGEIETDILSGFIIDGQDPYHNSNFVLYQANSIEDLDSIKELKSANAIFKYLGISSFFKITESAAILLISGSLADFIKLEMFYNNNINYTYHKHLSILIHFLEMNGLLNYMDSENDNTMNDYSNRIVRSDIIQLVLEDDTIIKITDIDDNWKKIITDFKITDFEIGQLMKVYCDSKTLHIPGGPQTISLIDFLSNYHSILWGGFIQIINTMLETMPEDFYVPYFGKNIFELNILNNHQNVSSFYDDIDEVLS